ncbi:hypothetical protein E1258_28725 [Micromonospora sp. KC207]|uniref:hypothetical protein n=1 Tax=Micromonospora sp. KC207 TaxID=2530377 RepID=UPI00104C3D72|nr:hypothetical protein [Micromonospora sp. KC207]TDC47255.1 hypothetical protein E1258_28725 [Micromonospora sp. KC207]
MRDSVLSNADEVLERLEDEIAFLAEGLAGVSEQLTDLTTELAGLLAGRDHDRVGHATGRVTALLGDQVLSDLTALAGLGAIRHGHPPNRDDGSGDAIPALTVEGLPAVGYDDAGGPSVDSLRDRLAASADHLQRLSTFVTDRFDLARAAAERGDADRALEDLRLVREAAGSAPEGYRLWLTCLAELTDATGSAGLVT